jgi:hypothetical protein
MEPGKIFAGALATAIPIELDVMEQLFRRPVFFRLIQHPRKSERDFEKRPAIQSVKIHRGRFDPVVDFQGKGFVTGADERASNRSRSLTDRERLPIFLPGLCDERIEPILSFENRAEWQTRFAFGDVEPDNEKADDRKRRSHAREYNVRRRSRFVFFRSCRICFRPAKKRMQKQ